MSDTLAVSRYARALFEIAEKKGSLKETADTLAEVVKAVEKHSEISHLVLNSTISFEEKTDFIDKIFPPPASKLVVEFLKVLIKKRRFEQLPEMQEEFKRLFDLKQGIKEVRVITAVPLSKENEKNLLYQLKNILNAEIHLTPFVDPGILGGLVLQFGGTEINGSFKDRLVKLKNKIFAL